MSQNICNICGANYEYRNGRWICPACGAYKAEELSNEEVTLLYNAAQKLRLSDFDEAEKAYADIIAKYPQNSEGYWGRLLARFGIKYEEDFDGKQIPTCYATIESIMSDKDYAKATSLADEDTKAYYVKQAEYIERVRKEWVEKARKEKPYDIFISYKDSDSQNGVERTKDSIAAQDLYIHLTGKGYRVFFSRESLRDKVGEKYEPYIFGALSTAKVMIVYGSSSEYITSTWVKNEWMRYEKKVQAGEKKKNSLIVACDGCSPSELPKALSSMQCLDATKRTFYEDLDNAIDKIIKVEEKPKEQVVEKKQIKKLPIALGIAAALVAIVLCILIPNLTNQEITNLSNSYYGISIDADRDVFPKGTELKVEEILSGEKYDMVQSAIGEKSESFKIYDIELSGKKNIDINGTVTVKIPLPNDMSATGISVYYISDKGAAEKLDCSVADGYVTFKTTHFSIYVIAEDKINNTGFEYKINSNDTVTINKYTGSETAVVIPQTIEGKNVVEIASLAFDSMDRITSVSIPETVTTIGAKAFYGCTSIETITIPETVTSMGTSAFYGWNSSQEIVIAGRKEIPSAWNAQWNGSCSAKLTYGLITIIFHANGASGTMSNQDVEINSSVLLNESKFTFVGYTFAGWATSKTGEVVVLDKGSYSVQKESVYHLYAVWSANENKVIFNANSGEGSMDAQTILTNEKANLTICTFTKDGYTFGGWATSANGSVVYSDGSLYSMGTSAENTLYAIWVPNNNALIFNSNGGYGSMDSLSVETNETITIPKNAFTLDGYTFLGWSDVQNGTVKYTDEQSFTMSSSATVTLYAVWKANENELTFNSNDGKNNETSINLNTGSSSNLPANTFTRAGYTFLGWSTTANGTVEYTDGANYTMGVASTTLYAVWSPNENKVVFNSNGGSGTMAEQIIATDSSANLSNCEFERNGYIFAGWATTATGNVVYTNGASYTMGTNAEYTLYAIWTIADYKIDYVLGGGTNNINNPAGFDINDNTITLVNPTRAGYTFNGWYSDANFQNACDTIPSGSTGNKTFYASWSAKENTLHFNANGGNGSVADMKINTDATQKLTKSTLTRDGYTFKGWSTVAGGSVDYVDEANYTMGSDAEYTLYAVWEIISYSITYNLDGGSISGNRTSYTAETETFTLPKPTKFGYTFLGWSGTGVSGKQETVTVSNGSVGDKTFTANWKANDYTITLNVNGGNALATTTIDVTFDGDFELPIPTRTGYEFKGWKYGTTLIQSGKYNAYDTSITLVAQWEIINYNLTYNTNGGTLSGQKTDYNINTNNFTLPTPEREGYTFLGWSGTDIDGEKMTVTVSKGSIGERSYTANWQANTYKVTFDANGGSVSPASKDIVFDTALTLPTPTRAGYTFVGWYLNGSKYTASLWTIASNKTLVAEWTANTSTAYTVKHYLENANDDGYTLQDTETLYGTTDTTVSPNTKSYTGFNTPSKATVKILGDGTGVLEYRYTRTTKTVTFVTNGGTAISSMTVKYQQTPILPDAVRDGFTFGGWFTDVALSNEFAQSTVSTDTTVYAWWEEENKPTDFSFTGTTGITIQSYNRGAESKVQIPAYIRGVPVVAIAENAFENHTWLKEVIVPNTVTTIGAGAFKGCSSIEKITLPFVGASRTATSYSSTFGYIFGYQSKEADRTSYTRLFDSISNVEIGGASSSTRSSDFVNSIVGTTYGAYKPAGYIWQYTCFNGSSYDAGSFTTSYRYLAISYYYAIPSSISEVIITDATQIPDAAFNGCENIASIIINESAYAYGKYAFQNCSELKSFNSTAEGTFILPTSLTEIESYLFYNCSSMLRVNIPQNATCIGEKAFAECENLSTVRFDSGSKVTSIEANAFARCISIETISMPDSVVSIKERAFDGCISLANVEVSKNLETIGAYAFNGCVSVSKFNSDVDGELNVPTKVSTIGEYAFCDLANIEKVVVPNSVISIGEGAFNGCSSIQKIVLPFVGASRAATSYSATFGYIFGYQSKEANSTGYTRLYDGATGAQIGSASDPTKSSEFVNGIVGTSSSVYNLSGYVWQYTCFNGASYDAGSFETSYRYYAISYYYAIPNSISEVIITDATRISDAAFNGCRNLTSIIINDNASEYGSHVFQNCESLKCLNNTTNGNFELPESISSIKPYSFYNCAQMASINIPKNVVSIGNSAFWGCELLSDVTFSDNSEAQTVDSYAFASCISLETISLPDSITSINEHAFDGCISLANVGVSKSLKSIGAYAFNGCVSVSKFNSDKDGELILPQKVSTIGQYAFCNLANIEKVVVSDAVISIGEGAFSGCNSIQEITLPFVGQSSSATEHYSMFGYIFGYQSKEANSTGYTRLYDGATGAEIGFPSDPTRSTEFVNGIVGTSSTPYNPVGYVWQYTCFNGSSYNAGTFETSYRYYAISYYYAIPTSLKKVTITVQSDIPIAAFNNCSNIQTIILPQNSVVGDYAFQNSTATVEKSYVSKISSWNGTYTELALKGSGTALDPYQINSAAEFASFANSVNAGQNYEGKCFILNVNINLNSKSWTPIGSKSTPFAGVFNGNGKEISNLYVSGSTLYAGLFGYVSGTITNLSVSSGEVVVSVAPSTGNVYAGTMVAYLVGTVENCYSRVNINMTMTNTVYAGGLIGCVDSSASVKSSYATGSVSVVSSSNGFAYAGGFVGINKGVIEDCLAFGDVSARGQNDTYSRNGGFAASNSGTLTHCYRSNEQLLTQNVTIGSSYCSDGTESEVDSMILYAKSKWDSLVWSFEEAYPNHKN